MNGIPVRPLIPAVLAAVLPLSAIAQRADIPRTASGRPDLNGLWQALGNAHWDIEPHAARPALAMQPGPVVPVPAGEVLALGAVGSDAGAMREIYMEDPGPPQVDSWMGQSVGRWEGDTFVVEVNGFNGRTWFDRAGNHHGAGLHVTERYTLAGPDHIWYEAEMDDSATFSRPWTIRMPLYRNIDPDARLGQFKCVEFVEELMYGHLRKNPIVPAPPPGTPTCRATGRTPRPRPFSAGGAWAPSSPGSRSRPSRVG
ncbi:MAG: hypothetical protein OXQ94_14225 [Gemmatimonadota bacterium]|nr:hypothetical protein [Gemmatimonadota bacterium]MDE2872833.1 hypothetical protein [Gemmatimonadota bacterium]